MVYVTPRTLVLLSVLCRTLSFFSISYSLTSPKGNNGLAVFNFGSSQFQNLLYLAGYDPNYPPFTASCSSGTDCVLPYLGRVRDSPSSSPPSLFNHPARVAHDGMMAHFPSFYCVQSTLSSSSQMGSASHFRQCFCWPLARGQIMVHGGMQGLEPSTLCEWGFDIFPQVKYHYLLYPPPRGQLTCLARR
jgi:hypothetical protein